jgi:uncharacterized membrane protein YozB (DUF420 family)
VSTADLPGVNAGLNGLAAVLLTVGFVAMRRGRIGLHKTCMLSAVSVSALFLVSYLTYHALHGSTKFTRMGGIRIVYFTVLITHVVLAAAIVPMVLVTLRHALRGRIDRHRRLAKWTWPIWMYVSVTGVVIYLMLYRWPIGV